LVRWRTEHEHHAVQQKGRFEVFADYHLRVGDVVGDTSPPANASVRQQRFDETEVGAAKLATLTEIVPDEGATFAKQPELLSAHLGRDGARSGVAAHDVFKSINTPGKLALLVSWRDRDAGLGWTPGRIEGARAQRHRKICIVRDYGMRDRREAPQFYPDVN